MKKVTLKQLETQEHLALERLRDHVATMMCFPYRHHGQVYSFDAAVVEDARLALIEAMGYRIAIVSAKAVKRGKKSP
jgi:hypothetical protein